MLASSLRPTQSCPTLLCGLTLGTLALPCGKAQARLGTGPSSCVGFAYRELTAIPAVPGSREGLKWGVRKMREQPRGMTWHSCGSPPHKQVQTWGSPRWLTPFNWGQGRGEEAAARGSPGRNRLTPAGFPTELLCQDPKR